MGEAFWRMDYFQDSGERVEKRPDLILGKGGGVHTVLFEGVSVSGWESLGRACPALLTWDRLLLDAIAILPDAGPAVVLATAALESLIGVALARLGHDSPRVPTTLWKRINDRGDWRKEPSVTEQFDTLLRVLTDRSLKDEAKLWQDFAELRRLRNSFVHEGKLLTERKRRS